MFLFPIDYSIAKTRIIGSPSPVVRFLTLGSGFHAFAVLLACFTRAIRLDVSVSLHWKLPYSFTLENLSALVQQSLLFSLSIDSIRGSGRVCCVCDPALAALPLLLWLSLSPAGKPCAFFVRAHPSTGSPAAPRLPPTDLKLVNRAFPIFFIFSGRFIRDCVRAYH